MCLSKSIPFDLFNVLANCKKKKLKIFHCLIESFSFSIVKISIEVAGILFDRIYKKAGMKSQIAEACFTFLAIFLFACGIAAVIFIGMLLMPVAFAAIFVLAIREIIIWKRKTRETKQKDKVFRPAFVQKKSEAILRHMATVKNNQHVA
jgi:Flp pilus assembly protein TadB